MSGDSDEELVERYQRGERRAFHELYERHKTGTSNYIRRLVDDDRVVEDLHQEAWMKIVAGLRTWIPDSPFRYWVYAIVRNHCVDFLRKRSRSPERILEEDVRETARSPVSPLSDPLERTAIEECVSRLNPEQREVFQLRTRKDLTYAEITKLMGSPPGLANRRMQLATEHLRDCLMKSGIRRPN